MFLVFFFNLFFSPPPDLDYSFSDSSSSFSVPPADHEPRTRAARPRLRKTQEQMRKRLRRTILKPQIQSSECRTNVVGKVTRLRVHQHLFNKLIEGPDLFFLSLFSFVDGGCSHVLIPIKFILNFTLTSFIIPF